MKKRLLRFLRASLFPPTIVLFFLLVRYMLGYSPSWAVVRDALCGFAIAIFVLKLFNAWGLRIYLGIWALLALGYGAVGLTYGAVDKNAIVALMTTNPEEAREFLVLIPRFVFGFYGAVIVLYALLWWWSGIKRKGFPDKVGTIRRLDPYRKGRWVAIALGILVVVNGASVVRALIKNMPGLHIWRINEVVLARDVARSYFDIKEDDKQRSIFAKTVHWNVAPLKTPVLPECDTCVLVMGESVRADFMGAFGAPWKNTPWMSAQPGIKMTDFLSPGYATVPSLVVELFAPNPKGVAPFGDNLITLAKKGGFETAWFSNQKKRSADDSLITVVSTFADHTYFTEDDPTVLRSDEALLAPIANYVKEGKTGTKRFIFVHLYGSHPIACNRTGGKYTEWFESEELSCYIESIRRTDTLLKNLAEALNDSPTAGNWSILYTSDHGLHFMETGEGWVLKHAGELQDSFKVPFFVTGSNWKTASVVPEQRSGRYFSLMVAEWLGLKASGPFKAPVCNWYKAEVCEDQNQVRIGYKAFQPIENLKSYSVTDFIRDHPQK